MIPCWLTRSLRDKRKTDESFEAPITQLNRKCVHAPLLECGSSQVRAAMFCQCILANTLTSPLQLSSSQCKCSEWVIGYQGTVRPCGDQRRNTGEHVYYLQCRWLYSLGPVVWSCGRSWPYHARDLIATLIARHPGVCLSIPGPAQETMWLLTRWPTISPAHRTTHSSQGQQPSTHPHPTLTPHPQPADSS